MVNFDVHGTFYNILVKKEKKKTVFWGCRLNELIATNKLSRGDFLHFSMVGPQPQIKIVYFGNSEETGEETDEDTGEESDEDDDPLKDVVIAQRVSLTDREHERLIQRLPPRDRYNGVPFVQRLTSTNLNGNQMVHMFLNS